MRKRIFLHFFLSLFIYISFQDTLYAQQAGKQVPIKIPATNAVTNALLYLPWDYNISGKSYPLICFFHGTGEAGSGGTSLSRLTNQGLPWVIKQGIFPYSVGSNGDTTQFVVLSIQASYYSPSPDVMVAGIASLIRDYRLRIDSKRIYPTGLSAGGRESLRTITNFPSKFPAAVVMSPGGGITANQVDSFTHRYVWFFQGIYDHTISPSNAYNSNSWINAKYPGHSRLTKYDNGHCCWTTFYNPGWRENGLNIYDFMLQHTLSNESDGNQTINILPKADAGATQTITLPITSAKLTASGSVDPDGRIVSYKWSQLSGPAGATFSSLIVSSPTITNLQTGTYLFSVTVKDNMGGTSVAKTTIIVNTLSVNKVPKASAGGYQTITLPVNTAKLDASASYDPDGNIASYLWTQVSGPSKATFNSTTVVQPVVSNLQAGVYVFDLTAKDNDNATDKGTTQVTVKGSTVNKAPRASAGGYQAITLPVNIVKLDASASYDPDGNIVSYLWTQASGPSKATFNSTTAVQPVVSNLQAGVYVFDVTTKDNDNATDKGTTQVTVKGSTVNKVPRASAGGYQTITLPVNTVKLDASASYDPDGTIASYLWTQVSGPSKATFNNTTAVQPVVSNLQAGVYVFDVTAKDNDNATNKGTTQVTVKAASNLSPRASAGGYQTISLPKNTVTLTSAGSYDPDGTIASYQWTQVSGPAKATFNSTTAVEPIVSNLQAGVYVFDVTAKDNDNATNKGTTQVTVKGTSNQLPRASAGGYQTITLPVNTVKLDASASYDTDGTITAYQWTQVSGPSKATFNSTTAVQPVVSNLQAGVYIFDVTAKDNDNATDKGRTQVAVFKPTLSAFNTSQSSARLATMQSYRTTRDTSANGMTTLSLSKNPNANTNTDRFLIYPNPAHDVLHITFYKATAGKTAIRIINLKGQVVKTFLYNQSNGHFSKTLNIENLTPGIYLIQLIENNVLTSLQKIIKY